MRNLTGVIRTIVVFSVLTILTQIGGLAYLAYKSFGLAIRKRIKVGGFSRWKPFGLFAGIYLAGTLFVIPPLAELYGRVPMPWFANEEHRIKPATILTCLANRHYVRPELKALISDISLQMEEEAALVYLDANFPFLTGFPLLPHKSHDDGEKIDLSFIYRNTQTGEVVNDAISMFGYGVTEDPARGEMNRPEECEGKGYWQYSLIRRITPQWRKEKYVFDEALNRELLIRLAKDGRVGKIFIEPHLKQRLGLDRHGKVRSHGCSAVRHDDHIHVQL